MNIWTPLEERHLPEVDRIADLLHPDLPEGPHVFRNRLEVFPRGCLALGDPPMGYCIMHPYALGEVPRLNATIETPPNPTCLHIHDVAVLPEARGKGASAEAVRIALGVATEMGIDHLQLVSVHQTHPLWERLGFRESQSPAALHYGEGARYMTRGVR